MQTLKRALISGLLLVWGIRAAAAAELPVASPAEVGLSSSKLNQATEAVQALVDKKEVAGAVIAVARHGKVVQLEALGSMDAASGKPMQRDTIFRIYSMTKPVTTVAAMMLYKRESSISTLRCPNTCPNSRDCASMRARATKRLRQIGR